MSEDNFSIEHESRIYHDGHGWFVAVREDRDGLNLCEIYYSEGDGKTTPSIVLPWEAARLLATEIAAACSRKGA